MPDAQADHNGRFGARVGQQRRPADRIAQSFVQARLLSLSAARSLCRSNRLCSRPCALRSRGGKICCKPSSLMSQRSERCRSCARHPRANSMISSTRVCRQYPAASVRADSTQCADVIVGEVAFLGVHQLGYLSGADKRAVSFAFGSSGTGAHVAKRAHHALSAICKLLAVTSTHPGFVPHRIRSPRLPGSRGLCPFFAQEPAYFRGHSFGVAQANDPGLLPAMHSALPFTPPQLY